MKIIFIGMSTSYSIPILKALIDKHSVLGIVESFSGSEISSSSSKLADIARNNKAAYFHMTNKNHAEMINFINRLKPDVTCVASMAQLLKKEALQNPRLGTINVHSSFLPKYRGADPIFWHFYFMEKEGGVTVHFVDEGIDTGNILRQEKFPITDDMDAHQLKSKAGAVGAKLILQALEDVAAGKKGVPQDSSSSQFYARKAQSGDHLIEWSEWPIEKVWRILRATHLQYPVLPPPPGWTRIFHWKVGPVDRVHCMDTPGLALKDAKGYFVAHREGKIRLSIDYQLSVLWRSFKVILKGWLSH